MSAYEPAHYTGQVMVGIAQIVHAAGLAVYRADDADPYRSGERGIYFDHSPAGPDADAQETFVITPYLPQSGMLGIERTSIQIRCRHVNRHTLWVRDYLDKVRGLFPDLTTLTIGGHVFDRVRQKASTSWGEPTKQGLLETTQNFEFRGNRYGP